MPLESQEQHMNSMEGVSEGNVVMESMLPFEESAILARGTVPSESSFSRNGKGVLSCFSAIIPYGGLLSTTFNLASATLGGGVISLAAAFQMGGVVFSIVLLILVTICTVYSVGLMMQAVEITGYNSYTDLSKNLFGRGWDYFAAAANWLFTFGTCVGYVIAIGRLVDPVLSDPSMPEFLRSASGNRLVTSGVWLLGMFSLSLPKEINSLRYASAIGVLCICYFILCIVIHSLQNGFKGGKLREDIAMFKTGNGAIECLSIFMFSYLCHMNCFSIFAEMSKPSAKRMTLHTACSMTLCCVAYIIAGFFGYADFGAEVTDTVLVFYDVRSDVMISIAYIGIAFKLCVGFSLCMQPARDSCYYIIGWDVKTVPTWKNCLFCGTMALAALLLGLFIPFLNTVFGLLGSFCGGLLGFCMPALFRMYCGNWGIKQVGIVNYVCTYLLLFAGVVAIVFGTGASIYGVAMS